MKATAATAAPQMLRSQLARHILQQGIVSVDVYGCPRVAQRLKEPCSCGTLQYITIKPYAGTEVVPSLPPQTRVSVLG